MSKCLLWKFIFLNSGGSSKKGDGLEVFMICINATSCYWKTGMKLICAFNSITIFGWEMQRPFKREMHNPQSDSIRFVIRKRHGRTGKNSPAAAKLQRSMVKSNNFEISFTKQHWLSCCGVFFSSSPRIVCKILFTSYMNEDLHTVC